MFFCDYSAIIAKEKLLESKFLKKEELRRFGALEILYLEE